MHVATITGLVLVEVLETTPVVWLWNFPEELVRILKLEKKLTKVTGVEVLLHAWRSQSEKLKKFLAQRFSLTKDGRYFLQVTGDG